MNIFQHGKTRYKGIGKNNAQSNMLFALSNLYGHGQVVPMSN